MTIRAVLFGATGMVGEGVLCESLNHAEVESVLVIGRRPCHVAHPKLKEVVHADFYEYSAIEGLLAGCDACFFCLGVSSIGMSEKDYSRVTYDLTMQTARTLSRVNPAMTFCYVSGAGTDSSERGRIMWARVKGKTENDLMKLPFKAVYLFRPGFLKPTRGLKNAFAAARILGVLYPLLRLLIPNYVSTLRDLGLAMIEAAKGGYSQPIVECRDIVRLAQADRAGTA